MNKLYKILQARKQTNLWLWFGRISPLLFLIGAVGFYEIVHTDIPFIFYASWVGFITVSLIWWGWVLKIILDFIQFFEDVNSVVIELKEDVSVVCEEVKKINTKKRR
jgi:hypothetical protein